MFPATKVDGPKMDRYGNITTALKDIRSDSAKREFVTIKERRGKLYPGVYQRFVIGKKGASLGMSGGRLHQLGKRSRVIGGRKISSAIRARGLRPVLLVGQQAPQKKRYDYYSVAQRAAMRYFREEFAKEMTK